MSSVFKVLVAVTAVVLWVLSAQVQSSASTGMHKEGTMSMEHSHHVHDSMMDTKAVKDSLVPQTTCPVMGGKINKKLYVDYKNKRIYICCAGCRDAVEKNPEKYIKKLKLMGQSVEVIGNHKAAVKKSALVPQKTCPVMGNPINKKYFTDHKGQRIYFCCAMCPPAFKKEPEKYLQKLDSLGEATEKIGKK